MRTWDKAVAYVVVIVGHVGVLVTAAVVLRMYQLPLSTALVIYALVILLGVMFAESTLRWPARLFVTAAVGIAMAFAAAFVVFTWQVSQPENIDTTESFAAFIRSSRASDWTIILIVPVTIIAATIGGLLINKVIRHAAARRDAR